MLVERLSAVTPEERRLLDGCREVDRTLYTDAARFVVDPRKLLPPGRLIALRPHTRFAEFPPHSHDYVEMMYVVRGSVTHVIGGREVRLEAGDLLLLGRQLRHAVRRAEAGDLGVNLIVLPEFFDAAFDMLGARNALTDYITRLLSREEGGNRYLHFRAGGVPQVHNLMENLVRSLTEGREDEEDILRATMGLLLLYLTRCADTLSPEAPTSYEDVLLRTALDYIARRYRTASLTELARETGRSLPALSTLIHTRTGFTFKALLQHKRLEAACVLLKTTTLPVTEIVTRVGYENNSYFHRRFREAFRCSPREYRLREKENDV